jgi:hypothetical protein
MPYEGQCCDAVLTIIERERDAKRVILSRDTPTTPGIEVRCKVGGALYAIEHTLIDPYPDKRRDDEHFVDVLGDLEKTLSGRGLLRSDCSYMLSVDVHAFRGLKRAEIPAVRENIRQWVIKVAPVLNPAGLHQTQELGASQPEVPVRVLLQCTRGLGQGDSLRIARRAPSEIERRKRMRAALDKKGPKLEAENRAGATAVLILENDDSALSNHIAIGEALHKELVHKPFKIDDVYLVETWISDRWRIWLLKQGGMQWPGRYENPPTWEFSPQELKDILAS